MKFTKLHWWYDTEIKGVSISVTKVNNKWEATGNKGVRTFGTTRTKAVEKWLVENEGRYEFS